MNLESYIVLGLLITLIIHSLKRRIALLENKLMHYALPTYLSFAKRQSHLEKVMAIKAIREQFEELSLLQAVKIYEMAIKESSSI